MDGTDDKIETRGRKKGTKNEEGHIAGSARDNSGPKPKHKVKNMCLPQDEAARALCQQQELKRLKTVAANKKKN